jgi:uncharacterized cupredoxin-like copper-binding protein
MQAERRTFIAAVAALAYGGAHAAARDQKPWGMPGDVRQHHRTIRIRMTDDMRFTPDRIRVHEGDTVRFILHNAGKLPHEMVIGTREKLDEREARMEQDAESNPHAHRHAHARDEPGMVHVPPGATKQLVWKFNRAGEFTYACLLPGHYEAGMMGTVFVLAQPRHRR